MADWNEFSAQTERRVLRDLGLAVVELRSTARGDNREQHGQRRMAHRVLCAINDKLCSLGAEPLDNGDSLSEDTIDKDLIV